jgi:hypothetical protein
MTTHELNILIAKYGKHNHACRMALIYQSWNMLKALNVKTVNDYAELMSSITIQEKPIAH